MRKHISIQFTYVFLTIKYNTNIYFSLENENSYYVKQICVDNFDVSCLIILL